MIEEIQAATELQAILMLWAALILIVVCCWMIARLDA